MDNHDPELRRSLNNAKRKLEELGYWDDELQEAYENNDHDYIIYVLEECVADLTEEVTNDFANAIDRLADSVENLCDQIEEVEDPKPRKMSFWEKLCSVFGSAETTSAEVLDDVVQQSNHPERRCNGDCDNCPSHYGYRYGRWYYGHGHQHGCERGGNGGASMRTFRD